MKLKLSIGNSRMDKKWNAVEMELSEFRDRISQTKRTAETVEQYRKLRGIDDPTPQAAIRRLCEEARRKNAASGTQNEAQTPPKTHGNAPPRQFDSKNE